MRSLLLRGDVPVNCRKTDESALFVCHRGHGNPNIYHRPVFPFPLGLVALDSYSSPDLTDNLFVLISPVRSSNQGYRLAEGFLLGVAEHSFCRRVPTGDDAVEVFGNDGVFRRPDNCRQKTGSRLNRRILLQRHVTAVSGLRIFRHELAPHNKVIQSALPGRSATGTSTNHALDARSWSSAGAPVAHRRFRELGDRSAAG